MTDQELCKWIRRRCLELVQKAGKGHLGGAFSAVEIFVTLYKHILRPQDILLVGKGHAVLAIYPLFEHLGLLTTKQLETYGCDGSFIGGQITTKLPGMIYNTGSLGHALGIGAGIAHAAKLDNLNKKVYIVLGDGEMAEGSNWEAADFAARPARHQLNNLIGIIDYNQLGVTGPSNTNEHILASKFEAFGWETIIIDGHDLDALKYEIDSGEAGPKMVIAKTTKGKGIKKLENQPNSHHGILNEEQFELAMKELI